MIENDAFKLLLINLFHLNPDDIANIYKCQLKNVQF